MEINARLIAEVQEARQVDPAIVRGVLARVPPSWQLTQSTLDGAAFKRGNIQIILSVSYELDHRIWIHVSACGRRSNQYFLLSWEDMKRVKHDFIGPDRWAYQVFPPESQYVNQHPSVLHLFTLLEGEAALPDFTSGTGSL
jgi:hypothetical protein